MAAAPTPLDLGALEATYRIVGELHGSGRGTEFVGNRLADGAPVVITIVPPPPGGDGNELSHFAADVNLLAPLSHPNIVPVIEARWIGNELALVTQRLQAPTLQDELNRGTKFRNPRIAMLLQDVWSALEWARERGVVHRAIGPSSVYFEPSTKRVLVSLLPATIPITGVPGANADARTVGTLAWAMLAGAPFDPANPAKLGELAPNLAERVVDAIEKLVRLDDRIATPDVPTALGIIAAGDLLKQGEVEILAMKEEYEEKHRQELLKCENHRMEVEQHAAEQAELVVQAREELEQQRLDQEATLAAERAQFEAMMAEREERLMALRAKLEEQAARVARGLDVEELPKFEPRPERNERRLVPTAIAAAALALAALVAGARYYDNPGPARDTIKLGKTVVVPTTPSVDSMHLPRGGFLTQTAGGTVATSPVVGPPLASPSDSLARSTAAPATPDTSAAARARLAASDAGSASSNPDSVARARRDSLQRAADRATDKPRPRPKPSERANDANGSVVPDASIFDIPSRRSRSTTQAPTTRTPPADTVRRDTLIRPDRPDTIRPRDTTRVRPDTTRPDTGRVRPDTTERTRG